MKGAVYFIIVAILAHYFVNAGHHHSGGSAVVGSGKTHSQVIEESERKLSCPHGFKQHGKHCIHTVAVKPNVRCPFDFFRSMENEHVCVKFFEKVFECPNDFVREKGVCIRTRQVEPFVQCPHGFTVMTDGRQCSRNVPLPDKFFCPHGSFQRGDVCIRRVAVAPKFVCPPGFTKVEDKRCKIVETFDCTPAHSGNQVDASHKHHKNLRLLGEKKHNAVSTVVSKEFPPTEKQIVVQKVCKNIRLEGASKICPEGSAHHGKECFVEEETPFHERKGGFKEEFVNVILVCPENSIPSSPFGRFTCLIREDAGVRGFCPHHTEPVDHKCAKFTPLIFSCPEDHKLEDGLCVKAIVAPPIVEFDVSIKCVGKDCGHHDHHHMNPSQHHDHHHMDEFQHHDHHHMEQSQHHDHHHMEQSQHHDHHKMEESQHHDHHKMEESQHHEHHHKEESEHHDHHHMDESQHHK